MTDPAFARFLLDHLWQSTIFAVIVFVVSLLLRRAPARVRYALYFLIPVKFLIPSSLVVLLMQTIGLDLQSFLLSVAWATSDPVSFVDGQSSVFHFAGNTGQSFPQSSPNMYAALIAV